MTTDQRVCWAHGRLNICRPGMNDPEVGRECQWLDDEQSVKAVMEYHLGTRDHWKEWKPGDPCGNCGSTKTFWSTDPTEGAICRDCGAADSDE